MTTTQAPPQARAPSRRSPYLGLFSYSEDDAAFFFGREREIGLIADNLLASRLTLLYGPSGVGKSSVLSAGVVPHLRRIAAVERSRAEGAGFTVVTCRSWRDDPLTTLAAEIDAVATAAGKRPLPVHGDLHERLVSWTASEGDLLVILDQFEEYLLYHSHLGTSGSEFDDQVAAVVNALMPVNLLVSIREDALAGLDRYKGKIPALFDNYLRIGSLDREAARQAITGPLDRYNEAAPDGPVAIEPLLVEAVLDQVSAGRVTVGAGGVGTVEGESHAPAEVEASHLQLVMTKLWSEVERSGSSVLRLAMLEGLGGAAEIVRRHLGDAMASLEPDDQDLAAHVFTHLVTPSGAKIAHSAADLAAWARVPQDRIAPMLERLASADLRILRPVAPPPDGPGETRYEIFHDVLAAAALRWARHHQLVVERDEARREAGIERRRRLVAVGLAAAMALLLAAAFLLWQRSERTQNELEATQGELVGQNAVARSRELAALSAARLAVDPAASLRLALEAIESEETPEAEMALRAGLAESHVRAVMSGHSGAVTSVDVHPSGDTIVTSSADASAAVWDAATGERRLILAGHTERVNTARFSPDGERIVTASRDGTARVWETATGDSTAVLIGHEDSVVGAEFSPDGLSVLTHSLDGTAAVWDARTGERLQDLSGHEDWVNDATFSADGALVATGSWDGTARVWDAATGDELAVFEEHKAFNELAGVMAVDFDADGTMVATAGSDEAGWLWRWAEPDDRSLLWDDGLPVQDMVDVTFDGSASMVVTAQEKSAWLWEIVDGYPGSPKELHGHTDWVNKAIFDGEGTIAASISRDGTARLWLVASGTQLATLRGHTGDVVDAAFTPDGSSLVTASTDGTARVWQVPLQGPVMEGHQDWVISAGFDPEGDRIVSAGADGTARVWNASTGEQIAVTSDDYPLGFLNDVAVSGDGRFAAMVGDGWVSVWDLEDLGEPVVERWEGQASLSVAFDESGETVVTSGADGLVRLWRWQEEGPIRALPGTGLATFAAISPDGTQIASGDEDGVLVVFDAESGEVEWRIPAHRGPINDVEFDRTGRRMVTASGDFTARVWDAMSGDLVATLEGHDGRLSSAAFSPDGAIVVTGATDGTLGLWEVAGGRNLALVRVHGDSINSVEFSPDGASILTASDDHLVRAVACPFCEPIGGLVESARERLRHVAAPAPREAPPADRTASYATMSVGTCYQTPEGEEVVDVRIVPCEEPHDQELFAVFLHPADSATPYPGANELDGYAEARCGDLFESYTGEALEDSRYELYWFRPTEQGWTVFDRRISCSLQHPDGPMTGAARDGR